jgi:hypothetical protein
MLLAPARVEPRAPEAEEPPEPLYPRVAVPRPGRRSRLDADAASGGFAAQWQVWATAEAPEIRGDEVEFVALPDGSLIVETEEGDAELDPLATAVEAQLAPPYHAKASRQSDRIWSVFANPTRVAEFAAHGEELTVTMVDGERAVTVDDRPSKAAVPELERLGEQEGADYVVRASRLDGDLWEIQSDPL